VFGGAGAQHACSVARILGIRKVVVHRFSGILSACGMGMADTTVDRRQPAAAELDQEALATMREELALLRASTEQELLAQGIPAERISSQSFLNLRYAGTDTALMIAEPEDGDYGAAFQAAYQREFGFTLRDRAMLIDDCRVRSAGQAGRVEKQPIAQAEEPPKQQARVRVWFTEGERDTPLYRMDTLLAGHAIPGPAILIQDTATIVVEPDCIARISSYGDVEIEVGRRQQESISTALDPVRLSVFANLFMSIAEQMGRMLQKTAVSTNIRERLDFSCALFDTAGQLVANAPHVPVHLGAMSEAVQEQIRRCPDLQPGDVLVSNHPAAGGSHLPDITVITPVFAQDTEKIIFWVASRGHHADIGGISPGSMPPNSRTVEEAGLVHAGTGENLAEARAPGFLETPDGRIALISAASTFPDGSRAGAQRKDIRGRPGLNPIRYDRSYAVTPEQMEALRDFREAGGMSRGEGDRLRLFGQTIQVGEEYGSVTTPNEEDLAEIVASVNAAKRQANFVIFSGHSHESGQTNNYPADFFVEVAHAVIDAGADVFLAHGSHVLRGIEIYKGKPIFYSLGDFVFQNETVPRQPADNYESYGLEPDAVAPDFFDARQRTGGFPARPQVWESFVAMVRFQGGELSEIRLHPITLGHELSRPQRGRPLLATGDLARKIIDETREYSEPFGTEIELVDGIGVIRIR